jgi:hypothetical protein
MIDTYPNTRPLEQYDKLDIMHDYYDGRWILIGKWTDMTQPYYQYIATSKCKEELCMWLDMNCMINMKTPETVNLDDKKKAVHH